MINNIISYQLLYISNKGINNNGMGNNDMIAYVVDCHWIAKFHFSICRHQTLHELHGSNNSSIDLFHIKPKNVVFKLILSCYLEATHS